MSETPIRMKVPSGISWTAQMIRPLSDRGVRQPASFVARKFAVDRISGDETLYVSAWGLYRAFLNGRRIGDQLLTPGWTCYDKRLSYQTYNIADYLAKGDNWIEIWIADGWFRSKVMWPAASMENVWGEHIGAIAQLHRAPGSDDVLLVTDDSWGSGECSVRRSGIYFGEVYDATVSPRVTHEVDILDFDPSVLVPHEANPVTELEPLDVVKSWPDGQGRTIYDFGQNCAGYCALEVRGPKNARIIVEHAEILNGEGEFYNGNFREAEARLEYTLAGTGVESYRPLFSFQGFRYARVTLQGDAQLISIKSVPITSVRRPTADFACGSEKLNRFFKNTIWSQRSNFIDVPTDCPQRDERLGWTGDIQVFAGTACYLADSKGFLEKFIRDVLADQRADGAVAFFTPNPTRIKHNPECPEPVGSTGWGDVVSVLPWTLWLHYADMGIMREALDGMVRWNEYVWSISDGPIVRPIPDWNRPGFTFGDWLQPATHYLKALPTIGDDAAATIYLYISSDQISNVARVLGQHALADRMRARANEVRSAFQREFITSTGRLAYHDQSSYALAILHDLIPETQLEAAKRYFIDTIEWVNYRIGTGFIGTPALLPALTKIGRTDVAEKMLLQEDVPGWLFQVNSGATTVWERWDGLGSGGEINDPHMNSYNHYAYGAVCQWMLESVAGFRPDPAEPGFRNIIFEPTILPRLGFVKAHHDSKAGRILATWTIHDDRVSYDVEIPEGAGGTLVLSKAYTDIKIDGEKVSGDTRDGLRMSLPSGRHNIKFSI